METGPDPDPVPSSLPGQRWNEEAGDRPGRDFHHHDLLVPTTWHHLRAGTQLRQPDPACRTGECNTAEVHHGKTCWRRRCPAATRSRSPVTPSMYLCYPVTWIVRSRTILVQALATPCRGSSHGMKLHVAPHRAPLSTLGDFWYIPNPVLRLREAADDRENHRHRSGRARGGSHHTRA